MKIVIESKVGTKMYIGNLDREMLVIHGYFKVTFDPILSGR